MKFKIGDKVRLINNSLVSCHPVGFVGYVTELGRVTDVVRVGVSPGESGAFGNWSFPSDLELVTEEATKGEISCDGGPSGYYDFPGDWTTLNDYIEYKSKWNWKEHSFHIANIVKATCRWGAKSGTTVEYDVRKIIYSAARVYKAIMGTKALREYLTTLLEDPQFSIRN